MVVNGELLDKLTTAGVVRIERFAHFGVGGVSVQVCEKGGGFKGGEKFLRVCTRCNVCTMRGVCGDARRGVNGEPGLAVGPGGKMADDGRL